MAPIFQKSRTFLILAVVFALFLGYSLFEEKGFIRLHQIMQERDGLLERVHDLKAENASLAERIRLLGEDGGTLEALAREELGLVKPGEIIYILPEDPGNIP